MSLKKIITPFYNSLLSIESLFFPVLRSKRLFKKMVGEKCNLSNPQTLNEKLMFYKLNLYWNKDIVARCADKYRVRDFVKEERLESILNTNYGVWDKFEEIEWEKLPNEFVLKLNTGSGCNLLVKGKNSLDLKNVRKTVKKWFRQKPGLFTAEQGIYQRIPKKIIAEKFIETDDGLPPKDYKFFCSYGEVKLLYVGSDRVNGRTKFDFYYPNWEWIDVKNCHPNAGPIKKPKNYDFLVKYASILSKRFPLVRIDFFDVDGTIYFSEITFTHMGCVHPFEPKIFDLKFGELFPGVREALEIK